MSLLEQHCISNGYTMFFGYIEKFCFAAVSALAIQRQCQCINIPAALQ
jgi:hypothetical protein